jgi:hypothetical protein
MGLLNRSKKDAPSGTRGAAGAKVKKPKPPRGARLKQMRQVFGVTRQSDPRLVPYLLIAFFTPFMLLLALGLLIDQPFLLGLIGFMLGLLAAVVVFGKRVQATAYAGVEGQAGAAAAVLQSMRGDWRVTPAAGFNREQEMVHRVLGRPGVILVAEGVPGGAHRGTKNLIANEKKRVTKVIGDTPVYDVLVGDEEGMVPLRGLEKHLMRLPRNIKGKQVNALDVRLKALGTAALPIPKGPMPKGGRMPRGKVR